MKFKTKLITLVVAFSAAISFALPSQVNAALNGIDVSSNNGSYAVITDKNSLCDN